ncbi:MAG: PEP-utilizing enzyme [Nanoarchaeota archaeon]
MDKDELLALIAKNGLRPASCRDLSLFSLSVIGEAYCVRLRHFVGFVVPAMAAVGRDRWFHAFMDEALWRERTRGLVDKGHADAALDRAWAVFEDVRVRFEEMDIVDFALEYYVEYVAAIGVHNGFWRLADTQDALPAELMARVARERERIASLYPEVERRLIERFAAIEGEKGLLAGSLRNATLGEFRSWRAGGGLITDGRGAGYVYAREGSRESVTSRSDVVGALQSLLPAAQDGLVRGQVAFPGRVSGRVVLLTQGKPVSGSGFVLVAPSTHPQMMEVMARSCAIVTDEGGVLSHASIAARELRIPCIIGTKNATRTFKDGDLVEVDADKGVVRKIQ